MTPIIMYYDSLDGQLPKPSEPFQHMPATQGNKNATYHL